MFLNCGNSCGGSEASIVVCEERLRRKKLLLYGRRKRLVLPRHESVNEIRRGCGFQYISSLSESIGFCNSDRGVFRVLSGVVSRAEGGGSGLAILRASAISAQNQAPGTPLPGPLQALPDLFPDSSM